MADEVVTWGNPLLTQEKPQEDVSWSDYGRALESGAIGLGQNAAALTEYAGQKLGSPELAEVGRTGRELAKAQNDVALDKMSDTARERLGASFLPGENDTSAWEHPLSSIGLKITSAAPSLIATIVPAGLMGNIGAMAAGAAINAGDIANSIFEDIDSKTDRQLQDGNEMYAAYRMGGMKEKEARAQLRSDIVGYAPIIAGAFTALTTKYGAEGAVARLMGGEGKAGVARGAARTFLGEGFQEGGEGALGGYLQGKAAKEGGYGDVDPHQIWSQALEGFIVGGALGAPVGAVEGFAARGGAKAKPESTNGRVVEQAPVVGPDQTESAVVQAAPVAPAPPAAPAAPSTQAKGRKARNLKKTSTEGANVETVEPGALSSTEQAAAEALTDGNAQAQDQNAPNIAGAQQAIADLNEISQRQQAEAQNDKLDQVQQSINDLSQSQKAPVQSTPIPERTETIDAQREQLANRERKAVLYTPGQPVPDPVEGTKRIKTKSGTVDYDPSQITAKEIRALVKDGRENEFLDLGSTAKQDLNPTSPDVAVVARDQNGVETRSAVGTPETAQSQLDEMRATQKSNEASVNVEPAQDVLQERAENPPGQIAPEPVSTPEVTQEVTRGPRVLETENQVAKQQREKAIAEKQAVAEKAELNEARGQRDLGENEQDMSDKLARQRFITRVDTELKKGPKAAPWAKAVGESRKKFGDALGRGRKLPEGYVKALQEAHAQEVAAKAEAPKVEKKTKKQAAKEATAVKREAQASKPAEQKIRELNKKLDEDTRLNAKDKSLVRAVLSNKAQSPEERLETADLVIRQALESKADKAGVDVAALGSGSKGGDRGLSSKASEENENLDDKQMAEREVQDRELKSRAEAEDNYSTDERGTDAQELADIIQNDGLGELSTEEVEARAGFSDNELAMMRADEVGPVSEDESAQDIARDRPKLELKEGEGYEVAKPVQNVKVERNALDKFKPKISGKISLNKFVKPDTNTSEVSLEGGVSALRDNKTPTFRTLAGDVIKPMQTLRAGDVLKTLSFDHLNGLSRVLAPKIRNQLIALAKETPLHVVTEEQMRMMDPTNPKGIYLHSGHIFIRADQMVGENAAHPVLHEAAHAAFFNAIRQNKPARKLLERMFQETLDHHFGGDQQLASGLYYGFENVDEFMSESLSSPVFQELLAATPVSEKLAADLGLGTSRRFSLWDAFVRLVRETLGLGASDHVMLEGILKVSSKLESTAVRMNAAQSEETGMSALRGEDVRRELGFKGKAFAGKLEGVTIKAATLDFIRQQFGGLFTDASGKNHLDDYVKAVQKREQFVDEIANRHDVDAAKFIELMRTNPTEAMKMADVAMDATRLNVNLGPNADNSHLGKDAIRGLQAKQRLAELQARYESLKPETRELLHEMTDNYRETHNSNVTALAYNVLSSLETKLSNSDLMHLLDRVTNGTLSDEDAKLVGDPTVFASLRRSTELRTIKGMYFPNMRFGDNVVLTREKVTAPSTRTLQLRGKNTAPLKTEMVGEDTVRFSADPSIRGVSAALKREAAKFAAENDLPLLSMRKVFIDKKTGEVVRESEQAVDREYNVGYEVKLQNQGAHFFDQASEAEKFRAASKSDLTSEVLDRRSDQVQKMISSSALSNVIKAIESRKDIPESRRKQMRNVLEAAIVANMPGNRAESRYQARRNVAGASNEVGRAALAYGRAAGNFYATLNVAPAQREALNAMSQIEQETKFGANAATISKVMNEIRAREADIDGPAKQNRFFQDVATLSFFDKLVSPAASIVNFQQVIMNSLPVLGGKYGTWTTANAIANAYRKIGTLDTLASGLKNTATSIAQWRSTTLDTTDLLGSIREKLGSKYKPLLDELLARGAVSSDAGLEIGAALSEGRGAFGTALAKFDRIARQLPNSVEAVNRVVTAVATYDLALQSGKSQEAAIQEAFDTVMNTQGDYRRSNTPRWMKEGKLAWAMQFKKYALMQTQLMGDMYYRALKGASPEEKAIARKQLALMIGVQVMYAGALGLPGMELVKLGFTLGAALGLGTGWDDEQRKIRQALSASIGKTPTELLTSGVISRLLGVDVSTRMSQADLWTGFSPTSYDAKGLTQYVGTAILGAPGATALDWMQASKELAQGNVLKAIELSVPIKTLADTTLAVRKYQAGEYNAADVAAKVVGFTSARQARIGQEIGDKIAAKQQDKAKTDALVKAYLNATSKADKVKAASKIREYNKTVPKGQRSININSLERIRADKAKTYANN